MKKFFRLLIGIGIVAFGVAVVALLVATKPEAKKESAQRPPTVVHVVPITFGDLSVPLPSQGLISPKRRTTVAAEVGGRVVGVSDKFEAGLSFEAGEVLLTIEDADYQSALAEARARLADAKLAYETEQARADQALKDWEKLGRTGVPSDLTLRKPQLESALAAIAAAEKAVEKAERDVARTEVKAPFAGRLARTDVELGAYLSPGMPVAEIFTTNSWEVRLPLPVDDWNLLERNAEGEVTGRVELSARIGGEEKDFSGMVVRTEGEVERDSRSIYVVAEIPGETGNDLLQPGLFVEATIAGRVLEDVARVPFRAFVDRDQVAIVDMEKEVIDRRQVRVERRMENDVIVSAGLEPGDWVSITQLSDLVSGMPVKPEKAEISQSTVEPALSTTKP